MNQNRVNLVNLRLAENQKRQVRFVYSTKNDGRLVPRIGTVESVTDTHAVILDTFHNDSPRSCVIERIIGAVELDRRG